jgi:catechol 2,3-dioxygenase-like lactoylglutathione lyase family enzyme
MQKRTDKAWMDAEDYGRSLPNFTVNLLVRDVERSVKFYRDVFGAVLHHSDPDFAALQIGTLEFMVHADHAYDHHAWYPLLKTDARRGLGAELRLFNIDPDALSQRAKTFGAKIIQECCDMPHGWRDVVVEDPDGYTWAVGIPK